MWIFIHVFKLIKYCGKIYHFVSLNDWAINYIPNDKVVKFIFFAKFSIIYLNVF